MELKKTLKIGKQKGKRKGGFRFFKTLNNSAFWKNFWENKLCQKAIRKISEEKSLQTKTCSELISEFFICILLAKLKVIYSVYKK